MECLLIVWMHINRDELNTGRTLPRRKLGLVILSTQIPSKFPGRPLTTSLGVPEPEKEKGPPPSLKFSPRKETKTPSVLLLQPKRPASLRHRQLRHFPSRTFSKV
ncbi:hypothetical protein AVEN_208365-1 [Araneus ventricosus]|uniref:Uncharacterized protein n=1 Tax=Araneus ventricosus TaxID=182803 RepID=A0A4Y2FCG0_ARAVE|nr:hypothetical protein AVEN_208365-1 [Araneus ventricosus]